ncbi:hypothetical protein JG688_00018395 [Phytophthora aleatoria]|uniref:Uncharacterized protein n=1 Tax=Phytophthora aleatoria TaxID=2496075 RepID=A0A8J5I8U0_9STRA|nr:hypothetical protein JG688_00018395 [Phytophthora aleatoria]
MSGCAAWRHSELARMKEKRVVLRVIEAVSEREAARNSRDAALDAQRLAENKGADLHLLR